MKDMRKIAIKRMFKVFFMILAIAIIPVILIGVPMYFIDKCTLGLCEKKEESTKDIQTVKDSDPNEVFRLVNEERIKAGVKPLARLHELDISAETKAKRMQDIQNTDHIDPQTGYEGMDYIVDLFPGLQCRHLGENIAWNYTTEKKMVDGWMSSQGHKENILNPKFTHAGMYITRGGGDKRYRHIAVQHFCAK